MEMVNWKSYFGVIHEELMILKKKQKLLTSFSEEKRISQKTSDSLKKEIKRVNVEIETRQKILDSGTAKKIEEIEKKIETLEKSLDQSIVDSIESLSSDRASVQLEKDPVVSEEEILYEDNVPEVKEDSQEKLEETENEVSKDKSVENELEQIDQSEKKESKKIQSSTESGSESEFTQSFESMTDYLTSTINVIENGVLILKSGNYLSKGRVSRSIQELLKSVNTDFEKTSEGDPNHPLLSDLIQLLNKAEQDLQDKSSEPVESLNELIKILRSMKN